MITEEMLVKNTPFGVLRPASGFTEFVSSILSITNTRLEDWSFTGHEGTQGVAEGVFAATYLKNDGFAMHFRLDSGLFLIDCKQSFRTDATGFVWWWNNSYTTHQKGRVEQVNPELIKSAAPAPRKKDGMSGKALKSLNELQKIAQGSV